MFAKRLALRAAAIATIFAVSGVALAQTGAPTNNLPNSYQRVGNWAKMPAGRFWGAAAGVDIDPDGKSVWVAERCGQNSCAGSNLDPILKFDASGKLVKAFGHGMFVFPHGINVDRDGNVWVTDGQGKDGMGHQVIKFSPDGNVLMRLGKPGVAGTGHDTFNMPSDVLVAPNGDIFVADGHGGMSNNRIVKFDRSGKYLKEWGVKGTGPGQFASRSSIPKASSWKAGRSSAAPAESISTPMTRSMSPIPNLNRCPRIMTAGNAAFAWAAPKTDRSNISSPIPSTNPTRPARPKESPPIRTASSMGPKSVPGH